jgi:hypothetical protein
MVPATASLILSAQSIPILSTDYEEVVEKRKKDPSIGGSTRRIVNGREKKRCVACGTCLLVDAKEFEVHEPRPGPALKLISPRGLED